MALVSFDNFGLQTKLIYISAVLLDLIINTTCFTCDTPDIWQSHDKFLQGIGFSNAAYRNANPRWMWENGIVKFSIDPSLDGKDREEIYKAIHEYHTKTCVRFEQRQDSDTDYVNIELNNKVCGIAHVCKMGGRQFAQFGKDCRDMNTMVHELGHTLCMDHEHQRQDRNKFLDFRDCPNHDIHPILRNSQYSGLYDYQSVMHYECNSCVAGWPTPDADDVKSCGMEANPGLSVLDADQINEMYNCQGCFRHRWRNAGQLTHSDRETLQNFGHFNQAGLPIYPCRTLHHGQVVVGSGSFNEQYFTCTFQYQSHVLEVQKNVEVLTIPGGLTNNQCHTYQVVNHHSASVSDAIPAAAKNVDTREKVYIAYSFGVGENGMKEHYVGEVTAFEEFSNDAIFPINGAAYGTTEYSVLTCSLDQICLMGRNDGNSQNYQEVDFEKIHLGHHEIELLTSIESEWNQVDSQSNSTEEVRENQWIKSSVELDDGLYVEPQLEENEHSIEQWPTDIGDVLNENLLLINIDNSAEDIYAASRWNGDGWDEPEKPEDGNDWQETLGSSLNVDFDSNDLDMRNEENQLHTKTYKSDETGQAKANWWTESKEESHKNDLEYQWSNNDHGMYLSQKSSSNEIIQEPHYENQWPVATNNLDDHDNIQNRWVDYYYLEKGLQGHEFETKEESYTEPGRHNWAPISGDFVDDLNWDWSQNNH